MTGRRLAEGSGLGAELLRSARKDRVPEGTRDRIVGAVIAAPVGLVHAAPAAVPRAWLRGLLGKTLLGTVLVLGGGAALVGALVTSEPRPSPGALSAPATLAAPPTSAAVPVVAVADLPVAPPLPASAPPPGESLAWQRPIVPPVSPPPVSSSRVTSLADEVSAIDRARVTLRGGDPQGALGQLARYDRSFVAKQLAREAALLRIEALEKAGDHRAAQALGREILRANPTLEGRIAALVGGAID